MTGKKHKKKMKSLKSLAKKSKGPVTAQSLLASVAVKNVVGKDISYNRFKYQKIINSRDRKFWMELKKLI